MVKGDSSVHDVARYRSGVAARLAGGDAARV